jgi:Mg/Co/Ni transporter MgtE
MAAPNPLRLAYARQFPAEMARLLAAHGSDAVAAGLDGLPATSLAALVAHLPRERARGVLELQDDKTVGEWLDEAALDDALAIARHLDDEHRTRVLESVSAVTRREALKRLLIYPRTTAGAAADPTAPRLDAALRLDDALGVLRGEQPEAERTIWLVDTQGRYVGLLDATRALASNSGNQMLSAMAIAVRPLRADTTLVNAHDYPEWHRHPELPVVDHLDRFLGSLSHERLSAALGDDLRVDAGLADVVGELTRQYFHVMSSVLGELFGVRGTKR